MEGVWFVSISVFFVLVCGVFSPLPLLACSVVSVFKSVEVVVVAVAVVIVSVVAVVSIVLLMMVF